MQFAPVLPPELYPVFDTGRYHLVQAHLIAHNQRILDWFDAKAMTGHTVIIDNGVIELGAPDTKSLFSVLKRVRPAIVVCPDAFTNAHRTIINAYTYLAMLKRRSKSIMVVPQGSSVDEWMQCADTLLSVCHTHSIEPIIGMPKVLDTFEPQGRYNALSLFLDVYDWPQERIHLLGVWFRLSDLTYIMRDFPRIAGVDSTLPYAHAIHGVDTNVDTDKITLHEKRSLKITYNEVGWEVGCKLKSNIKMVRNALNVRSTGVN